MNVAAGKEAAEKETEVAGKASKGKGSVEPRMET